MANIEPERLLVNFLREKITDINTGRTSQFIYDDFPQSNLRGNSFPRISVTKITESSENLGMFQNDKLDTVTLSIDFFSIKDKVYVQTVVEETIGVIADDISPAYVPTTVTEVKTAGAGSVTFTVVLVADDSGLGSPPAGTVQISRSSGRMRWAGADLVTYAGATILISYTYNLSNDKVNTYLARQVINAMCNEWRNNRILLGKMFYPRITENNNQPFNETTRTFRRTVTCQWGVINAGVGN